MNPIAKHNEEMKAAATTTFMDSEFKKSGDSAVNSPICVEVARKNGLVAIRDSKNKNVAPLVFSNTEWEAFANGVKRGDFNV